MSFLVNYSGLESPYPSPPHTNCHPNQNIIPLPQTHPQTLIGGILDSPRIDVRSGVYTHWPISPPPTLPTLTTSLPCVAEEVEPEEEDQQQRILEDQLERHEPHLLSPLSPESSFDFGFGIGSLDTLFEEEELEPSQDNLADDNTSDMTPHQHHVYDQEQIRLPYPSPDISPEFMTFSYPVHSSQGVRFIDSFDLDLNHDYEYFHDGIGTQSPSLRTFGLPEVDSDSDEGDLGLPELSSFPTSPEASSSSSLSYSRSLSPPSPPSPPSPYPSSSHLPLPPLEVKHDFDTDVLRVDVNGTDLKIDSAGPGLNESQKNQSLLLLDVDGDVDSFDTGLCPFVSPTLTSSSSLSSSESLLEALDSLMYTLPSILSSHSNPDSESGSDFSTPSHTSLSSPASSAPASPPTLESESLGISRVLPTLIAHPELHEDLYSLLLLRRQAKERERVAKAKEKEDDGERAPISMSVKMSPSPSSSPDQASAGRAQAQARRVQARKERRREKERRKEIGSLIELTLVPPTSGEGLALNPSPPVQNSLTKRQRSSKMMMITSMPKLVARMILRRRDSGSGSGSSSSSSVLRSPGPPRTKPYVRSPLWQCMTMSDEDAAEDGSISVDNLGSGEGVGLDDNESNDDVEDDDDNLGLCGGLGLEPVGLQLRGFA